MDLRVRKTKQAIMDTFKEMIISTSINKITITALANKANINRKTFYLHYETIEDLISDFLNEIADAYIQAYEKALPEGRPHQDANRFFFEYFSSQPDYVQKILCYPPYHDLGAIVFDKGYLNNLNKHDSHYKAFSIEKQNVIQTFYRSATLDIYRQWIKDEKRMSLDEAIKLSNQLICNGVQDL